jgi:hypothetical protein
MRPSTLPSLLLAILSSSAVAQNMDAASQVQNLLSMHGLVPYTHQVANTQNQTSCFTPHCNAPTGDMCSPSPVCNTYPVTTYTTQTDHITLTATNIHILSSTPVTFDPLVTTSQPDNLTVSSQEFVNCASVPSVQAINLQVSFTKSTSLALSTSVTNTASYSLNFNWKPIESLSLGGSATIGTSQTTGSVNTNGENVTTSRTSSTQVTLAQGQAVVGQIEVYPVTLSQVFHSTVLVDADLSQNDQFQHLSDVYIDPATRTFPISGTIAITDASEGKSLTYNAPDEPTVCGSQNSGVKQISYIPQREKVLMLRAPEGAKPSSQHKKAPDKHGQP